MAKKILIIVGSMREQSFNRQLSRKAAELLSGKAEVSWLSYRDIPYMNQDIEFPAPREVLRVRKEVSEADGIWIFTPEYNHSYPGVLKNLLDWLSRPVEAGNRGSAAAAGKKTAISGAAGKSAAAHSRSKLRELLTMMQAEVLEEETGISLDMKAFQTDLLELTEEDEKQLAKQAEAFLQFLG